MSGLLTRKLATIEAIMDRGPDAAGTARIVRLLDGPPVSAQFLEELRLFSEYLPKAKELGFTAEQRHLHFLWDFLDRTPCALAVNFAFRFRRLVAERLFKKCGSNFIAEEGVPRGRPPAPGGVQRLGGRVVARGAEGVAAQEAGKAHPAAGPEAHQGRSGSGR